MTSLSRSSVLLLLVCVSGAPLAAQESSPNPPAVERLRRDPDDRGAGIRIGDDIIVGGRLTATFDDRRESREGREGAQRTSELDGGAQFQASWKPSRRLEAYAKAASFASSSGPGDLRIYEAFVVARRVGGAPIDVQVGRQRVRDTREWFFDEYVDGARIRANVGGWRLDALAARSLFAGPESQRARHDKQHVILSASRRLWPRTRIESFLIARNDRSPRNDDPVWTGASLASTGTGATRFWVTSAVRRGHSGATALAGWAVDGGISQRLTLPLRPVLTVGYARASGDRNSEDRADQTFRQTGLEDNEGRFDGAKVFAYYGSVLQPELSNLEILTAAVSLKARRRASLDLVYHRYAQVVARSGTSATALRWRTSGSARHLGDELDAIVSFRLAPTVDFNITAGILHAGSASTSRGTVFEWRPQIRIYF